MVSGSKAMVMGKQFRLRSGPVLVLICIAYISTLVFDSYISLTPTYDVGFFRGSIIVRKYITSVNVSRASSSVYLNHRERPLIWWPAVHHVAPFDCIFLPTWMLCLLLIFRTARDTRIVSNRYCSVCNYDLSGSMSAICPECGGGAAPARACRVQKHHPGGSEGRSTPLG